MQVALREIHLVAIGIYGELAVNGSRGDGVLSRTNWTHSVTEVAVADVHVVIARIEVEVPCVVRVVRVERTRPVVAVAACEVEAAIVAVASGGQEETVAVRGGEEPSVHAVLGCPCDGRVVAKFLPFLLGGHTPIAAPIGCGRVVLGQQGCQVVGEAVVAPAGVVAILGQSVLVAHTIQVGAPIVGVLRLRNNISARFALEGLQILFLCYEGVSKLRKSPFFNL